jgi:hypothetical protein
MANTQETGHAKNTDNFDTLIAAVTTFGTKYNPSNTDISVASMQLLYTSGADNVNNVSLKNKPYQTAVAIRKVDYKTLSPLCTRIIGAMKASKITSESIVTAKGYVRKIRGVRAVAIPKPKAGASLEAGGDIVAITHSVAQTSFTNLVTHLNDLTNLLVAETNYSPNEKDLDTAGLILLIAKFKKDNKDCDTTYFQLAAARSTRNTVLYQNEIGIVPIAMEAKNYVKSVFGLNSSQNKLVSKITFTNNVVKD